MSNIKDLFIFNSTFNDFYLFLNCVRFMSPRLITNMNILFIFSYTLIIFNKTVFVRY